jgi:hypothetical protein
MRTESDLQSVFRALEDVADDYGTPEFHIPPMQLEGAPTVRHASRVRVVMSSLAAAAAVVAVLALATVIGHRPNSSDQTGVGTIGPSPTVSPSPSSTSSPTQSPTVAAPRAFDVHSLWFTMRPISGVVVSGYKLFANVQQVQLDTSTGEHWDVTLAAAGAPQPTSAAGSQPITIAGRPGYYGALSNLAFATQVDQPIGLVWQYAPDAWATVVSPDVTAISSTDAKTVADAVQAGVSQAVRIPIKVKVAPPGQRVQGYVGGPGGSRVTQHGIEGVNALIDFTTGTGTSFTVDLAPRVGGENLSGKATTIAGRPAYVDGTSVAILVDKTYVLRVGASAEGPALTTAQVIAVANSVAFPSSLEDQNTWFVATEALP